MSGGFEFVDDERPDPSAGPAEDVLDTARAEPVWWTRALAPLRRRPGLRRGGAVVAVSAVLTSGIAAVVPQDHVVRGRGSAAPEPAAVTAQLPAAVAIVRGVATARGPLTDYVRQTAAAGACPTVPVGTSPTTAIRRAVEAALPDFTVQDVASTLDEFTGLCSVRLRARDAHRVVLAVVVSAPPAGESEPGLPFTLLQVGSQDAADGTTTEWVSGTTVRHWSITVGAVGRSEDTPTSPDLQRLAEQDALTW